MQPVGCTKSLVPAELGGLRIKVCRIERGIFLDENELVALNAGKKVAAAQAAALPEAKVKGEVNTWLDSLGV